ncbi:MAG: hypothetical protein E6J14_08205 [Chloroflexi bacterium]|nr:MAG: hypothetical protein E6J14_08205 [Chloroflexota bacterium]
MRGKPGPKADPIKTLQHRNSARAAANAVKYGRQAPIALTDDVSIGVAERLDEKAKQYSEALTGDAKADIYNLRALKLVQDMRRVLPPKQKPEQSALAKLLGGRPPAD